MGCDIHWIIERKHRDGIWEAVHSKAYAYEKEWSMNFSTNFSMPIFAFGQRDYQLFGILSDVRYTIPNQAETLAHMHEMPGDASEHTQLSMPLDDPDLHTHGWFTLGELRRAAAEEAPGCAPEPDDKKCLVGYLELLEALIDGPNKADLTQILVGPQYDNDSDVQFPQMQDLSNHTNLENKARAEGFLPIGDDTLRVVICYDN